MKNEFVDVGNITKIYLHQGKFFTSIYTIYQGKEVLVCPPLEGTTAFLDSYPAICSKISENISFCFRKIPKSGLIRIYLEQSIFVNGKMLHQELCSVKSDNFMAALEEMNTVIENLDREESRKKK